MTSPTRTDRLALASYRKLKARALSQALAPSRKTPTAAVLAWRVHLLELLALHVAHGESATGAPTAAELLQLQRVAEGALKRARE